MDSAKTTGLRIDDVSIRRWFAFYFLFLLATGILLLILLSREPWSWTDWFNRPRDLFITTDAAAKLLGFAIYLSLCCTFLPLPTGWIVAAVATREAAICPSAWCAALVVGAVGAAGSTIANLNDYHIFTWMLRHHRIGKVRETRLYRKAAGWFSKAPFLILVIFNIVPIPVDVIRMLATTYRYPRPQFAAANFIGRFVRYGVIAYVTFRLDLGTWAVLALLGLAVVLALCKILPAMLRKIRQRPL